MKIAPIVIFSLGKYHHLKNIIGDIHKSKNAESSQKYAFIDYSEKTNIQKVKKLLNKYGYESVFRPYKYGLYKNICDGVSSILSKHPYAIFIEEDLRISSITLLQMTNALEDYQKSKNVGQIVGHTFALNSLSKNFFIRKSGSLCWGTWTDVWVGLNHDTDFLIREIREKKLINFMNLDSPYNFYQMLIDRHNKKNDSWAIIFYANMILKNLLTYYPLPYSVFHAGYKDGTNRNGLVFPSRADGCINKNIFYTHSAPIDIKESKKDFLIYRKYMYRSRSIVFRFLKKIFELYARYILKKEFHTVPSIDFYKGYHN